MDIKDRYLAYAAAFEETYDDDDWSRLGQFFTENASYAGGPDDSVSGRDAMLAKLKVSVDGFDRRMDSRTLTLDTPSVDGNTLEVTWQVHYQKAGCPDLQISGTEIAEFDGDRIIRLRDVFDESAGAAMGKWLEDYGDRLGD